MGNVLKMRTRALSEGWYPSSKAEIYRQIDEWKALLSMKEVSARAVSGVVPHAGWYFCGSLIFRVIAELKADLDTVVILGGHNPADGPLVGYPETGWNTTVGVMRQDTELVAELDAGLNGRWHAVPENQIDNTVEVVMVLLAAMRPSLRWAAWRVPADERAVDFGGLIAETASRLGRKVAVLGSTDLTHYGVN